MKNVIAGKTRVTMAPQPRPPWATLYYCWSAVELLTRAHGGGTPVHAATPANLKQSTTPPAPAPACNPNGTHISKQGVGSGDSRRGGRQSGGGSARPEDTHHTAAAAASVPAVLIKLPQDKGDLSPACLDGTEYGFYFRPSATGSTKWSLNFEGGGWCYDEEDCYCRATTYTYTWPATAAPPRTRTHGLLLVSLSLKEYASGMVYGEVWR